MSPRELWLEMWSSRLEARWTVLEDSLVLMEVCRVDPWDCLFLQPPWSYQRPDTSGTCRTDTCSSVSCPRDSSYPPDKHTWRSSELFSWRIPCNPRTSSLHSVDKQRGLRTQRTAVLQCQSWAVNVETTEWKSLFLRHFNYFYRDSLANGRSLDQWHFRGSKDDLVVVGTPKIFASVKRCKFLLAFLPANSSQFKRPVSKIQTVSQGPLQYSQNWTNYQLNVTVDEVMTLIVDCFQQCCKKPSSWARDQSLQRNEDLEHINNF